MPPTPLPGRAGQRAGSRKDEQPAASSQAGRAWQQPPGASSPEGGGGQPPGAPWQEEGAWQLEEPEPEVGACSPAPAQFRAAWEAELTPVSHRRCQWQQAQLLWACPS